MCEPIVLTWSGGTLTVTAADDTDAWALGCVLGYTTALLTLQNALLHAITTFQQTPSEQGPRGGGLLVTLATLIGQIDGTLTAEAAAAGVTLTAIGHPRPGDL